MALNDGDVKSMIAREAITRHRAVKLTSTGNARELDLADTQGEECIGIAMDNAAAGDPIGVHVQGSLSKWEVTNVAGVTKGDELAAEADGGCGTAASADHVVALALETGAQNDIIEVLVTPHNLALP